MIVLSWIITIWLVVLAITAIFIAFVLFASDREDQKVNKYVEDLKHLERCYELTTGEENGKSRSRFC